MRRLVAHSVTLAPDSQPQMGRGAELELEASACGRRSAAPAPFATSAFTVLTVIRVATLIDGALLFSVRDTGDVCVRRLAATATDTEHEEPDHHGHSYQKNGTETHRSRLSSDRLSSCLNHHRSR